MAKLAFDTGGTFTDFALIDDAGELHVHKLLSTPLNPAEAVIQGLDELLEKYRHTVHRENLRVLGATTVVTNAVLERRGAQTAFVTTDGFQDILRIRNEGRYDLYDLKIQYPLPLVSRAETFGVQERITAHGEVLTRLDEEGVLALGAEIVRMGIKSIAICLLHAYKYPVHERRILEILNDAAPGVFVTISSDVCPEMREFDRASTTVANAYTRPLMEKHVDELSAALVERGVESDMLWMTSSGGLVSSSRAAKLPVRLIESGPAAGAVAASEFGRLAGETDMLSFDMGGTTAKLCLIPNGEPTVGTELEVAHYHRFRRGSGFPLKIQSIHLIEIGAGGGSIAYRNPLGLLSVGPRSAGALPGPAAYLRGGTEPTVTDADIVLGYMGTDNFVGGSFKVSKEAATAAIDKLAAELGVTRQRCAWGIHDLVNEAMAKAAAMHATDLGVDPRRLPMVAFGGAGPVHAYGIARKLGMKRIICPAGAGVTSALGLLIAPVAVDISTSHPMPLKAWNASVVVPLLNDLAEQGARAVLAGGVPEAEIEYGYSVDMRYVGQGHEINVALPSLSLPQDQFLREVEARFYKRYVELFGRKVENSALEIITWRMRAGGKRSAARRASAEAAGPRALKGHRDVFFESLGGSTRTAIYDHYALPVNEPIEGPAIIEQRESSIVVGPEGTARVDSQGNLVIDLAE